MKVEQVICDQCGLEEDPMDWEGIDVVDRGADPEELDFCSYRCLRDWAEEQFVRWEQTSRKALLSSIKNMVKQHNARAGGDSNE